MDANIIMLFKEDRFDVYLFLPCGYKTERLSMQIKINKRFLKNFFEELWEKILEKFGKKLSKEDKTEKFRKKLERKINDSFAIISMISLEGVDISLMRASENKGARKESVKLIRYGMKRINELFEDINELLPKIF